MKFSTSFVAMLSLVGRIKSSLNCYPSLELRDITHAQCTYTHLFTGRISKLGLHSLQSYGCVRITFWITLVVSDKIQFEFLYAHDLGPRSSNDLDLQYSHTSICSIRCLLLLTFRSMAAIVSEKSTFFTFSYRKA